MNIQFHYHNISENIKAEVEQYAKKRFERLEKHLSNYDDDEKLLTIHLEYFQKHNAFQAKCTLQLGGKTIHHDETKHLYTETIDLAESNLVTQVKKIKDQYHKKEKFKEEGYVEDEEVPVVTYDNI